MLDRRGQAQQAKGVRDRRTTLADSVSDLFVRQLEVVDQLLERSRFLEWRQILAMEVFDQRLLDDREGVGASDQGGDGRQSGPPSGAPAPLACDQLVAGS